MQIKTSFSPGEDCLNDIIELIQSGEKFLDVCVFTISDNRIADELVKAFDRGVDVRIISDNEKMNDIGSDIQYLWDKGLSVKIDMSPYHMHHKFMIVDEQRVITGFYNWTKSAAQYNHENTVIIESEELSRRFSDMFSELWETCVFLDENNTSLDEKQG